MHCVKGIKLIIQKEVKHTAIIDCELLSKVYVNLLDQKEPILNFESFDKSQISDNKKSFIL